MNAVLLAVPVVVFALVVLFGFAGCWLDSEGKGKPDDPPQGDPPWEGLPLPDSFGDFIFQSGPVAWWPLTDPDGAPVAMDKVGEDPGNHPGSYVGTVIRGPAAGDSLDDGDPPDSNHPTRFDGSGHIEVPLVQGDTTFATDEFSVEALVLPDEASMITPDGPPPDAYVVRNFSATGGWALEVVPTGHGDAGVFVARIWDSGGVSASVQVPYSLTAPLGSAWWVMMRYSADTLWLRVNNDLDAVVGSYAHNTTEPLQIGVGFHGALQHIVVYDRVLSEQEALDHMQGSKTP